MFIQIPLAKQQEFHEQRWKALEDMFEDDGNLPNHTYDAVLPRLSDATRTVLQKRRHSPDFKAAEREAKFTPEQQVDELEAVCEIGIDAASPEPSEERCFTQLLQQVDGMDITTSVRLDSEIFEIGTNTGTSVTTICAAAFEIWSASFCVDQFAASRPRTYGRWFVEAIGEVRKNLGKTFRRIG